MSDKTNILWSPDAPDPITVSLLQELIEMNKKIVEGNLELLALNNLIVQGLLLIESEDSDECNEDGVEEND